MQADGISMAKGWKLKMDAWGKGLNQNKGLMSLMAKKQECHPEYYCGNSKYSRTDLTTLYFFRLHFSKVFTC